MFQTCNICKETILMEERETFIRNAESPMHYFPTENIWNHKHGGRNSLTLSDQNIY